MISGKESLDDLRLSIHRQKKRKGKQKSERGTYFLCQEDEEGAVSYTHLDVYKRQQVINVNEILKQALLFDFYGELLTDHQKEIYGQFLLEDLSLGEIARDAGISRQGVHDIVKRCEQSLAGYEEKLHLVEKFMTVKNKVKQIDELLDEYEKERREDILSGIRILSGEIIEELQYGV